MENKQEWIEKVMQTAGGQRAVPREQVWLGIVQRIKQAPVKVRVISLTTVSVAAACILLLLAVNIYTAATHERHGGGEQNMARAIVEYYDITNDKDLGGL